MKLRYAIIYVSDMERSVSFYRDVIGLPLSFQSPKWTEFSTDGATLALHIADTSHPAEIRPDPSAPGQCQPGIEVDSLDVLHSRFIEKGVTCVQLPTSSHGTRFARYLDPDSLGITVSEKNSGT